jgi:hypothetical protein
MPDNFNIVNDIISKCDSIMAKNDLKETIRDERIKKIVDTKLEIKYNL